MATDTLNMLTGRHQETQQRSLRVPSPPKVFIPPPKVTHQGLPDFHFLDEKARPDGIPNSDFLQGVNYYSVRNRDVGRTWRYEERREAQDIIPFIYLGPDLAARDKNFLTSAGITMCVAIRSEEAARRNFLNPKVARDLGIPILHFDVADNQQLIGVFPQVTSKINEHINQRYLAPRDLCNGQPLINPGKVLVFCETGNERSAAVVAAYIMSMYNLNVEQASQLVQAARFCIALDYQFANLLASYQSILRARRDVHRAAVSACSTSRKRSLDDSNDSDMEMDDVSREQMDLDRFVNRQPLAPFTDVAEFYDTMDRGS